MDRTANLIAHILANPDTVETGGVAYELLTEYQRGSPTGGLRLLLASSDDRVAGEAAWIASELSERGRFLIDDVRGMLGHRSKTVRFWALDCVLLWAGPMNGPELAFAVTLVDDPEKAVRWKALNFLLMASLEQLRSALFHFEEHIPESPFRDELRWMLSPSALDSTGIADRLRESSLRHRKFAAVAAARRASVDLQCLRDAVDSDDPEVAQFARDALDRTVGL